MIKEIAPAIHLVADLMSRIKPDWWPNPDTAIAQLQEGTGWYISCGQEPTAWLMFKHHPEYKSLEVNCMGFDNNGQLDVGQPLNPLILKCQEWGKENAVANIAYIIGSTRLNCHGKDISQPWLQLRDLKGTGSGQFEWLQSLDFLAAGILPNAYAPGHHGVLMIKTL